MRIEIYRITKCGFYKKGDPEAKFAAALEMLSALQKWVNGRQRVEDTSTFESVDAVKKVYCKTCFGNRHGYGIALWNSVPSTEKGVAYIRMNDKPGKVKAGEQEFPEDSIAGWPSYFWFTGDGEHIIALISKGGVQNRGSALPELRRYIKAFLQEYSSYVVRGDEVNQEYNLERQIMGWRESSQDEIDSNLIAKFTTTPLPMQPQLKKIRERVSDIRKLVYRVRLSRTTSQSKNLLKKVMVGLGMDRYTTPEKDTISAHWEVDWQPKIEELNSIMLQYSIQIAEGNASQRIGVRFSGDLKTYWFDHAVAKLEISLSESLEFALDWHEEDIKEVWHRIKINADRLIKRNTDG
jgi:hypothetical protein